MRRNDHEEFLGVDVGDVRIGIARGSTAAKIAQPLKTVPAAISVDQIRELVQSQQAAGIVVGLPRNLDSEETAQTQKVRSWAEAAKRQIDLPFYWQDEALTSVASQNADSSAGSDAVAAAAILQDFLDTPVNQRVRC